MFQNFVDSVKLTYQSLIFIKRMVHIKSMHVDNSRVNHQLISEKVSKNL